MYQSEDWQLHLYFCRVVQQGWYNANPTMACFTTSQLMVLVYVDDLLLIGWPHYEFVLQLKKDLHTQTHYHTFPDSRHMILGEATTTSRQQLNQHLFRAFYYENMLRPYDNNNNIKPTTATCLEQQPLEGRDKVDPQQHSQYRTTVGELICASLDSQDLMFAAKLHSSRLQQPTAHDRESLKHTLRYIKKEHKTTNSS